MQKGFCWVIQLFSLVCTVKGYYDREASVLHRSHAKSSSFKSFSRRGFSISRYHLLSCVFPPAKAVSDKTCSLPVEEAGIIWDGICLLCLLLQRRVFLSFYFLHVVAELQASAKQASRCDAAPGFLLQD